MSAAPVMQTIEFDESNHIYRVGGEVWPSVTQVLEDVGIIDYGFLKGEDREYFKARGSAVHAAIQLDLEHDLREESVVPPVRGFLEAQRNWKRDSGFEPELIEHIVWSPRYRYIGRMDGSGKFRGLPTTYIVDYKTGTALNWCRYQTAGYAGTFDSPKRFPRLSVELHEDATYRVEEYHPRDWQHDFSVFLAALTVYNAKRRKAK